MEVKLRATRYIAPFGLRIHEDLKSWIKAKAEASKRSMNSEILARLEESRRREESIKQEAQQ